MRDLAISSKSLPTELEALVPARLDQRGKWCKSTAQLADM